MFSNFSFISFLNFLKSWIFDVNSVLTFLIIVWYFSKHVSIILIFMHYDWKHIFIFSESCELICQWYLSFSTWCSDSWSFYHAFFFLNSVFCTDCWYIFFNWEFSHVFYDCDFLVFIIIFQLIFCIVIFLIISFHLVTYILKILVNNIDFVSLFCDVFHICCHDILFNMIICMSLNFLFS